MPSGWLGCAGKARSRLRSPTRAGRQRRRHASWMPCAGNGSRRIARCARLRSVAVVGRRCSKKREAGLALLADPAHPFCAARFFSLQRWLHSMGARREACHRVRLASSGSGGDQSLGMAILPRDEPRVVPAPLLACLEKGRTRIEMSYDPTLTEIEADDSADGSAVGEPSDGEQPGAAGVSYGSDPAPGHQTSDDPEIGRASCRERVCSTV